MKTKVSVRLDMQVSISDAWGDDCTIGQVRAEAMAAAKARVSQMILPAGQDRIVTMTLESIVLGEE